MSQEKTIIPVHRVNLYAPEFSYVNEYPIESHGLTLKQLAVEMPFDAYLLLRHTLELHPMIGADFYVETAIGVINSSDDDGAARGAFIQAAKNNLNIPSDTVADPVDVIVGCLGSAAWSGAGGLAGYEPQVEHFKIAVRPSTSIA